MASEPARREDFRKFGELIAELEVAMMTTAEPDGSLRSRPMHTLVEGDFVGTLWFFTKEHSPKVFELDRDRHVNLSYACPKSRKYVSLSGQARLVHDRRRTEALWKPTYTAWFPQGIDDPDLALLRVEVDKGESWDTATGTDSRSLGGD